MIRSCGPLALALALSVGCSGRSVRNPERVDDGSGEGGSATGGSGSSSASGAGQAGDADASCEPSEPTSKRLVRLSFTQIVSTMVEVLGPGVERALSDSEAASPNADTFPPLASPREGVAYQEGTITLLDDLAQRAGRYVSKDFAAVTGCAAPTDDCARSFLAKLAARAFRRELTEAEQQRIESRYAAARALGSSVTVEIATEYGVYGIFHSPQFTYRMELGDEPERAGKLSSLEVASLLSYFLTNAPPDDELQAAAEGDDLTQPAALAAQARRLLETPQARRAVTAAFWSYLGLPNLESTIIQDPAFTQELRASMKGEAQRFLERVLWQGRLHDLLQSRTTFVDARLASLYGIGPFPPPGARVDGDGFAEVTLPPERAGVLTQPAFLASHARPDGTSVVQRGLVIRRAFVNDFIEPPPQLTPEELEALLGDKLHQGGTARQAAEARAEAQEACGGCHARFDAYGVVLEAFDAVGRYRTLDEEGRPIDTSFPLPEDIGGGTVADVTEVAEQISTSGVLLRRWAQALSGYALAPGGYDPRVVKTFALDGCLVSRAVSRLEPTSTSMTDLIEAIVTDPSFVERAAPR